MSAESGGTSNFGNGLVGGITHRCYHLIHPTVDRRHLLHFVQLVRNQVSTSLITGRKIPTSQFSLFNSQDLQTINVLYRGAYTRLFVGDGNFTAIHQERLNAGLDAQLTNGELFMTETSRYKLHIDQALETKQVGNIAVSYKSLLLIPVRALHATSTGLLIIDSKPTKAKM